MNHHLLTLEHGPAAEVGEQVIADLFREAHSLKGAARAVNLTEVETLSHGLESLFAGMREGRARPSADLLEHAYRALDSIAGALERDVGAEAGDGAADEPAPALDGDEPAGTPVPRPRASEGTVRIATGKVDALLADVGELLVSRISAERRVADVRALEAALEDCVSTWQTCRRRDRGHAGPERAGDPAQDTGARLHAARRDLAELRRELDADARRSARITTDLQDDVRRIRMQPVSTVFEPYPRMVRDLARDGGKKVTFAIRGGDVEVDRSVLELIGDPLTHLLRNSVDHGIEAPQVRADAGKPTAGTITLSAQHRGDRLVIEVADDGTGIDIEAVRACAARQRLLTPAAAAELSDRQAVSLIFRSGLSTSPIVTDLSGRGVGLDVVRAAVERLHGSVDVESRPGAGTTFSLSLPLSISSMRCLVVEAEGQAFALPVSFVERVLRVRPEDVGRAEGRQTVRLDGRPLLLARLAEVLGLGSACTAQDHGPTRPVMVLRDRERCAAFLVDRLVQTCEAVVKSLPDPLFRVRHLAGATVLGSGRVAMILSPTDLMASVERADGPTPAVTAAPDAPPPTILVVEDSITTRTLEKNLLEAAGYRVRVAGNGAEGWSSLQSGGCDLVVADVEMPVLDGFELTGKIRADQRYRDLPVVLVTSRDARADRERGIQAGADAYLVKGGLDQDRLLDTIRRLI
jgi:two-component system, chemotaxis family, sensor kinase CheA